jgi:hypothetical protein
VTDTPDTPDVDHWPFDPQWPDDGLVHRIGLVVEVPSGPGVEIVAAQVLLDVIQSLTHQGLVPASTTLRITSWARPRR